MLRNVFFPLHLYKSKQCTFNIFVKDNILLKSLSLNRKLIVDNIQFANYNTNLRSRVYLKPKIIVNCLVLDLSQEQKKSISMSLDMEFFDKYCD